MYYWKGQTITKLWGKPNMNTWTNARLDARTITEQKRYGFIQLNASGLDNKTQNNVNEMSKYNVRNYG